MTKKAVVKQLWLRLGDASDYEVVESPHEAGHRVGDIYEVKPEIRWTHRMGVEVDPGFTGYNYISLFWGDDDAQPLWPPEKAGLTTSQKAEFTRGVLEGAGFDVPRAQSKKSAKPKARKQKTRTASVKGLRGKR